MPGDQSAQRRSATGSKNSRNATAGRQEECISIVRIPNSREWEFSFSPGLDLLEVARVISVVQGQAFELMQRQLHARGASTAPAVDESLRDTVEF
jgi:hypothetical protein